MADKAVAPTKKSTSAKSPSTMPAHPSYAIMISSAINSLKESGGSSRQAILKNILANKIADAARTQVYVKLAIRKMLANEKLIQVKGSFKLPKEQKVEKPKKVKEPVEKKEKKPTAKKAAPKAKKPVAKTTKKSAPKKPAVKPAVKPAKKTAAKKPVAKVADKKPAAKKVSKK